MPEIQEDMAETAIKWMLKVPKLSADLIVAALKAFMKSRENHEPVGIQKMDKLMAGGENIKAVKLMDMDKDMKMFKRLARRHGVGFNVIKETDGYSVFFRAGRAEQMDACIKAYADQKLNQNPKECIKDKLNRAIQQTAEKRIEIIREELEHPRQERSR